jgi:uncharacterized membrane protein YkoI
MVGCVGSKRSILKRIFTGVLGAVWLIGLAGLADAQQLPIQPNQNDLNRNVPAPQTRNPAQANGKITERQAVNLAKQRFAGNILRISLVGEGENQRYQIRMENEGKVFTVFVHVATGRVSGPG